MRSLLHSPPFVQFICAQMWCHGVLPTGSACLVLRHSESGPLGLSVRMWGRRVCWCWGCLCRLSHTPPVSVPPQPRESSPPQLPVSAPPTGLDDCLFSISLVLVPLAVRFSVSSGCAKRRSVSTYAAILVLCEKVS